MLLTNQILKSSRCDSREIFSSEAEEEEDGVLDGAEEGGDVEEGEDGGERLVCKNQISKKSLFQIFRWVREDKDSIGATTTSQDHRRRYASFSHQRWQRRIDCKTTNPSLPTGMGFLIHPC